MKIPSDDELRALVDEHGVVRYGALEPPPRAEAFAVFAQRPDARLDIAALERHATQFFDARIGLAVPKRYFVEAPKEDGARIVVAPNDTPAATRFAYGRPRRDEDLDAAEAADIRAGSPGLGALARRCPYVWLIACEGGEGDRHALLLAAIFASVLLGPILAPDQQSLFGVRTARAKLEKLGAAYR